MYIWERGPKSRLNDHHGPTARSTEIVGNNVLFFFFLSPSLLLSFSLSLLAPQGRKIFGGVSERCRDIEVGDIPPKIGIGKEEGGGTRRKRRKKSEVKVGDFFCGARFF